MSRRLSSGCSNVWFTLALRSFPHRKQRATSGKAARSQTATQRKFIITLKFRDDYSVAGAGSGTFRCQSNAFGRGNLDGNKRHRIIYLYSSAAVANRSRPTFESSLRLGRPGDCRSNADERDGGSRTRDLVRPHGFAEFVIQRLDRTVCIGQRLNEITKPRCTAVKGQISIRQVANVALMLSHRAAARWNSTTGNF